MDEEASNEKIFTAEIIQNTSISFYLIPLTIQNKHYDRVNVKKKEKIKK